MHLDILSTRLQGAATRRFWAPMREKRIVEALGWSTGTHDRPVKHLVATLPKGVEVYFLKPGKEKDQDRDKPNPHDMTPFVGNSQVKLQFNDIWSGLAKISLLNFESFKIVLTLIYRNAYFLDHVEKNLGIIRYEPHKQILKVIEQINNEVGGVLPMELLPFLNYLDILGWNEDVKYNVQNNEPNLLGLRRNTGRINTLLSCIRPPYQAAAFVTYVLRRANAVKSIDFSQLFPIMQQFSNSRGVCPATQGQVKEWLQPYVISDSTKTDSAQKRLI